MKYTQCKPWPARVLHKQMLTCALCSSNTCYQNEDTTLLRLVTPSKQGIRLHCSLQPCDATSTFLQLPEPAVHRCSLIAFFLRSLAVSTVVLV